MKEKKHIVISLEHPAWVHQFRSTIRHLQEKGHKVTVFAIDKDLTCYLLDTYGISFKLVSKTTGKGVLQKAWLLVSITIKMFYFLIGKKPDVFIGRGSPMVALMAFFYQKPHIIYEDTERSKVSLFFCKLFSTTILTNKAFLRNLGPKQFRVDTHKELFYLHPDEFDENHVALEYYNLKPEDTYTIIRFVAWTADHDFGQKGISLQLKIKAVKEFLKFGRVFITSEVELPKELEQYKLQIRPEHIHIILKHATLVFGESATMATEGCILGVHSIFCYFSKMGYTSDLEDNYKLLFNFGLTDGEVEKAIKKGKRLLSDKNIKLKGLKKRKLLLEMKQNGTQIFWEQLKPFL